MGGIPKDLIKQSVNLVEYIAKYYPHLSIRPEGASYTSICPFHKEGKEKHPSLKFKMCNKGYYRFNCYVCGEDVSGDIINFVQLIEKTDFKGACRMIANNVGIEYNLIPPNPYHEKYKDQMTEHMKRYHLNLKQNESVLNYLKVGRGLNDEMIDLFMLGLVPNEEYKIRSDIGYINNRISIPIFEVKNNVNEAKCLAMGYRTLDPNSEKRYKYINDKNQDGRPADPSKNELGRDPNLTGVFIKGQCLYGLSHTKDYIKKFNSVVIVEGYFDVISLYQSNIRNVVGTMSAEITEYNINVIKELTNNIIFYFDNDSTGFEKTIKILPKLYQKGFNVKIVLEGKNDKFDAADMCLNFGFDRTKVARYIEKNSVLAIHYQINEVLFKHEKRILDYTRNTISEIDSILNNVSNQVDRNLYQNYAKKRLNL